MTPAIVIEILRLLPVPGKIFESREESLDITVPDDMLAPMAAAASREGNPNPFPKIDRLPGEKQGALNEDSDVRNSRSNETAEVTVPI